ncbi:MAG: phosphodiester glycosidase family protein [Bacillota bacterium]|nr:phosphodiester glycosidase family protein [Bacillota bacterium]
MKRKILSIVLTVLVLSTLFAYGDMLTIYEEYEEDYINKGVIHQQYERYTDKGKVTIDVLKIILDENNYIKPIYNKEGIINKKSLSQLTIDNKAVAGINGDFYFTGSPSYPYGALIDEGNIISSPNSKGYNYPTFIKKGEDYLIEVIEDGIKLETDKGDTIDIAAVNKMGAFNEEAIILNRNWGEKSLGKYKDSNLLEILVSEGRVREIRETGEPFDIPDEDGYVLVTNGLNKENIISKLEETTRVEIKYNFDLENMDWGLGAVNYLVKEGRIYNINKDVSGRQPRSALAVNKGKDELYFVAVDGRSSNSVGFTQEELADFILEIGGYEAVNLDGGGSTTLTAERYEKIEVLNTPSDGRERSLVSGLGVFSNYDKTDKNIEFVKVGIDDKYFFSNQEIKLNAIGYNKYNIPIEIDKEYLNIISDLITTSSKDNLVFKEFGEAEVKIKYGEFEETETEVGVDIEKYYNMSKTLYDLGLFDGVSTTEFSPNLEGSMNRQEAMKMIVSALGWEPVELENSPFSDVSNWAKPFVDTAYTRGITLGTAPEQNIFGAKDSVTKVQLLTFYLRALGYESNYAYNNAERLGEFTGISENLSGESKNLKRYDLVAVTYDTLKTRKKGEDITIAEKLASESILNEELAKEKGLIKEKEDQGKTVQYSGNQEIIRVNVIQGPYEINMEIDSINIGKNEKLKLGKIEGVGEKGLTVELSPQDLEWSYDSKLGKIEGEYFESSDINGAGYLEGRLNEAYIKIPVVVGHGEKLFNGFEDLDGVSYEEYPEESGGSMLLYPRAVEGSNSLKLNYDFTSMIDGDQAIAFVNFGEDGITLPNDPVGLKMMVFGDNQSHWLRARIIDAEGTMYKIDFAEKVNWWDWKEVTAQIPKEVKYPIKLQNIYIAEIYDDMKDAGSIYLDDLKILYLTDNEESKDLEKSKYTDKYISVPDDYDNMIEFKEGKIYLDGSERELENNQKNIVYYQLNIKDGSILDKIDKLKELSSQKNKKIIINTNNPIENLYQNEYNGFVKLMEKALENDSEVIVVHKGESSNIYYENGFRYIKYKDDLNLYINEGNFYYKFD